MRVVQTIFSQEELELIQTLPEVLAAHERLASASSVSFTVPASGFIKQRLAEHFQLDLSSLSTIPCRWIKGDTSEHTDRAQGSFENTYLVYLTDGEGEFHIGDDTYSMMAGTGFSFSEGVAHSVTNTNGTSRLLMGPMSEQGFAVGGPLFFPGGTIVYIREESGTLEYSTDQANWNQLFFTFYIANSDTSLGFVKVYFTTDITLTQNYDYFVAYSDYIQFGNESLNADGTRPTITINVANYDGLIVNGSSGANGYNNVTVYNLAIDGTGGSLQVGAGWFGQNYFGKGSTGNYVINCSSLGDINGGGILGDYAENVTLIGCSSSGNILDVAGGIVGQGMQSVTLQSCWSTGAISGNGAGGIVGANSISGEVVNCYSEGDINGANTGGIVGSNAGSGFIAINNCYSRGTILGGNAGGICGSLGPASGTFSVSINNCYSTGDIVNGGANANGGICGLLLPFGSGTINLTITHCYTTGSVVLPKGYIIAEVTDVNTLIPSPPPAQYILTNNFSEAGSPGGSAGSWSNLNADTALTGTPVGGAAIGDTWVTVGINQPYELAAMGYSPYLLPIISSNSLVRTYSQTVVAGAATGAAIRNDPGGGYQILQITGGDAASWSLITINANTGAITAPASTVAGTYTLYLRSTGSYNITSFVLTVTSGGGGGGNFIVVTPCCNTEPLIRPSPTANNSSEVITVDKAGKTIIRNVNTYYDAIANKSVTYLAKPVFGTYREYMEYLQSNN